MKPQLRVHLTGCSEIADYKDVIVVVCCSDQSRGFTLSVLCPRYDL